MTLGFGPALTPLCLRRGLAIVVFRGPESRKALAPYAEREAGSVFPLATLA